MSYHILHVYKHGAILGKRNGFLTCRGVDGIESKIPYADVRAVIIAARGVTITSNFMSAILQSDGIILHCDEKYQPCGITSQLSRITDKRAYLHQADKPSTLNDKIWNKFLKCKTNNQIYLLKQYNISAPYLELSIKNNNIHEGTCAKKYWKSYFPLIGFNNLSRTPTQNNPPNQMLNYGYAVLSALCHRSLLIYGLSPQLGVQHKCRFHSSPLVYDMMEMFRPILDLMLSEYIKNGGSDIYIWSKKVGSELRELKIKHGKYKIKLMDAIDLAACNLARCYAEKNIKYLFVPELER